MLCPVCGTEMRLFGVESETPARDLYTFEEIREHRRRLLHESRMHTGTWVSVKSLTSALQEEINIVDVALSGLQEEATDSIN
jgi:hypothetical protein